MKVTRNVLTISDLYQRLDRKELVINKDYQRGGGLWPLPSRSYFIDTILNEYPFPKITIRQIVDPASKSSKLEIVDGQQRLGTINDFLRDNLRLTSTSKSFAGLVFSDLDTEAKQNFLSYEVSVDSITRASDEEVLETFRRMNSYMLQLNRPELRHSRYQGQFKWFVLSLVDQYSIFFENTGVLTIKEISRMRDAELITELSQIILDGILNKSDTELDNLYKKNDIVFEHETECRLAVSSTIDYIKDNMHVLFDDGKMTSYLFYSLFAALAYNKYGLKRDLSIAQTEPEHVFCLDSVSAIQKIKDMLSEIDVRREQRKAGEKFDNTTKYAEFAIACESSTHRLKSRETRVYWLLKAIQKD